MNGRILILGKGFIGRRLQQEWRCPVSTKRIATFADVSAEIRKYRPGILVNCIGHTGKGNVDGCELALDKTLSANTYIPILLAEVALRNNIKLVHISSGCIYHYDYTKQRPITEDLLPDYYHLYYSRSKIYAENALRELAKRCNVLVVRVRIPLDDRPHPKNILTKLIKFKKVIDIPNSLTYVPDFVKALEHLIKIDAKGIYNTVCRGGLRYPRLLDVYQRYVPDFRYKTIALKQLKLERTNLLLSVRKLEQSGFKVRAIGEILEECVQRYTKF